MANLTYISRFNRLVEQLKRAIANDDQASVQELDRAVSKELEAMFEVNATDLNERRELSIFLLEQLIPTKQRSPLETRICDKLIKLIAN